MRIRVRALALAAVASAGSAQISPPAQPTVAVDRPIVPKGARLVERSAYATILNAPPSPTAGIKSQRQNYRSVSEWYAQEEGLPLDEARKRLSEQQSVQPIFERLQERLRASEADNYVEARLVHRPDWAYVLHFKRDPEATLRKYSVHPRFRAAQATYTQAELQAILEPWAKTFGEAGIAGGWGVNATEGRVEMMMLIPEAEYRALALEKGWGELPAPIQLGFAAALPVPRVDPRIARLLRGFASESRSTGIQLTAGYSGRAILDDGCLRLATRDGSKGPLVVFHRETGLGLDAQGYLATIDRRSGKATGRIGENWSWAGPNGAKEFDGMAELKAACGDGPIVNVGNPESEARFKARYPGAR